MNRAIDCCNECVSFGIIHDFYVSSDIDWAANERVFLDEPAWRIGHWLLRPAELAQDDTPMIDVVRHALEAVPGESDDIWCLLQPTAPLRKPEHVREAIRLLLETGADSVVSVVELPRTHSPDMVMGIYRERNQLEPFTMCGECPEGWERLPKRRQDARAAYMRDGTCYAFWRSTVAKHGTIYGRHVRPLIIPPEETCELDTEQDWAALEARLRRG